MSFFDYYNDYYNSVQFPGAVNSKFTSELNFVTPASSPTIPTYRVMDSDGIIVDKSRRPNDIDDAEVIEWYKNMVTGMQIYIVLPHI